MSNSEATLNLNYSPYLSKINYFTHSAVVPRYQPFCNQPPVFRLINITLTFKIRTREKLRKRYVISEHTKQTDNDIIK